MLDVTSSMALRLKPRRCMISFRNAEVSFDNEPFDASFFELFPQDIMGKQL